jgi:hypothetical protein
MLSFSWAEIGTMIVALITIITAAWRYGKSTKEMEIIINNSIAKISKEFDEKLSNQVPRETFDELKQDVKDISKKVDAIGLSQAKYEGIIDLLSNYLNIHVKE